MTFAKHLVPKVLGIVAAAAVLLPGPALAEFGMCPPCER
jgi:hypothetical protein